ncbi:P1 family peptidase [Salipiger marinus]|uniref:DmpA family aminopeptidase n=1 Tax=Salipiger marinus TaxID=555512 RepID=UPI001E3670B2|nr:P1 family peptidase [Salipiger manganoxidans]MCD1619104.1 P1 family peptidase [Salipiger manganoxidans]MEB3420132.1 P1 family peptidase [Salipiger manganoxidans]
MTLPCKPRARALGLPLPGTPGPLNAITDVPGVEVGTTELLSSREPALARRGIQVQTGVTAILPRGRDPVPRPVWAGQFSLNGNGEMTGAHWIRDGGWLAGPILLSNSHAIGPCHGAAVRWMIDTYGATWEDNHLWAMPVVAETYDGVLNDINGLHVTEQHARAALDAARPGPVAEGNSGGGAGMICYEFKGGTGTASRRVPVEGQEFTLGALVQANHGLRPWLTVAGRPVGPQMPEDRITGMTTERGSIIVILATDLPLGPGQLERLARRAALGIGRGGTPGGNNSGDIFLAFSTANAMPLPQLSGPWRQMTTLNDERLDPVYLAAVEAVDEAVLNALCAAEDVPLARPATGICRAIDTTRLQALVAG